MNSIDDFARMRPEVTPPSSEQLDSIWSAVTGDEIVEDRADERAVEPTARPRTRRRFAAVGAAAAVLVGVVGIAAFAERAEAPPSMSDVVTAGDVATDAGEPPLWGVAEAGWSLVEFDDRTKGPVDMVRLFAGPDGLATSWVAIVNGMSEPLLPIGTVERTGDSPERITTQRVATENGSAVVIGAGVTNDDAMSVFRATHGDATLPGGFVESNSVDAIVRTIRYRFENDAGQVIDVETTGGGIPNYDGQVERWGSESDIERGGVDESAVLLLDGEERVVIARSGFWVTTMSADPAVVADLQPVTAAEWEALTSNPVAGPSAVAVGDHVMLGAASELVELGFTVDAAESRSFVEGVDVIRDLVGEGSLPDTLVVHLGNNGTISEALATELGELVADVGSVVLVTSTIDGEGLAGNDELLIATAEAHDNIVVLHWDALAAECEGDCFFADDLHLTQDGAAYYAALVAAVIEG